MNKFNFLEKNNVTYIIIGIFILFALIHLYKINSNSIEGFSSTPTVIATLDQSVDVNNTAIMSIPNQSQVQFGIGDNKKSMAKLFEEKANKSLVDKLIISVYGSETGASLIDTKADKSAVVEALAVANNAMPELSIIAYAGSNNIPAGWQLCDGEPLRYYKLNPSDPIFLDNVRVTGDAKFINLTKERITQLKEDYYMTPNLQGRFILGAGQGKVLIKNDTTGNVTVVKGSDNLDILLANRNIKDVGGEEKHKLLESEMPRHNHQLGQMWMGGGSNGGDRNHLKQFWPTNVDRVTDIVSDARGNDEPHNNMPPYYVLTYIIKQPIKLS